MQNHNKRSTSFMTLWVTTILTLLSLSSPAIARTHFGVIILDDGQRIEQATYKVKLVFKIVEVIQIGNKEVSQKIEFQRIDALFDKNGVEVTRKYLGRFANTQIGPSSKNILHPKSDSPQPNSKQDRFNEVDNELGWDSNKSKQLSPLNPKTKLWNLSLRLGSNFSFPAGGFFNGKAAGTGFGIELIAPVNHFLALRATISRSGLHNQVSVFLNSASSIDNLLGGDRPFTLTRFNVAAEYYFYDRSKPNPPSLVGFVYSGLGALVQRKSYQVTTVTEGPPREIHTSRIVENQTHFLSSTGAGLDLFLNSRFGIEAAVNMDIAAPGRNRSFGAKYAYIFDFRLGLIVLM